MTNAETYLVTGSTDGLGLAAARKLLSDGLTVIGHARNQERAADLRAELPGIHDVLVADATSLDEIAAMADKANSFGTFDGVILNAGVGYREPRRIQTRDGHAHVFQINTLAPYMLAALMRRPKRLVWLSSGLHRDGLANLNDLDWEQRFWSGFQAYADTKLHDATLAMWCARSWPDVISNALEPGWVATKMGGAGAPDDLEQAHITQVWLAEARSPEARTTGGYWYHQRPAATHPAVRDPKFQDALVDALAEKTGIRLL